LADQGIFGIEQGNQRWFESTVNDEAIMAFGGQLVDTIWWLTKACQSKIKSGAEY